MRSDGGRGRARCRWRHPGAGAREDRRRAQAGGHARLSRQRLAPDGRGHRCDLMVAEGELDADGAILARVREKIGAERRLVATLDYHGNVSPLMVAATDAI